MTSQNSQAVAESIDEPQPPQSGPDEPAAGAASIGRVVAVDLVRALALFGMFAINIGAQADWVAAGVPAWLAEIPHGRSSSTFAVLAGFSLALLVGGQSVKAGRSRRQVLVKIAIRGIILILLGTALVVTGAPIPVILISYGVYFLLALPFTRLKARGLIIAAAVVALVGPFIKNNIHLVLRWEWLEAYLPYDPIVALGRLFSPALGGLLLGGGEMSVIGGGQLSEKAGGSLMQDYALLGVLTYAPLYPALAFMAYVLAGMALGRLSLSARAVQIRLVVIGPALMLLGYGTSLLFSKLMPEKVTGPFLVDGPAWDTAEEGKRGEKWLDWKENGGFEAKPSGADFSESFYDPFEGMDSGVQLVGGLLNGASHSGATAEIIGNIGVTITLVTLMLVALSRLSWLRRLMTPLIAAGSMTLTAYVVQAVVYARFNSGSVVEVEARDASVKAAESMSSNQVLLSLIVGTTLFAFLWSRFFRRGPLEYLMYLAGKAGRFVR